MSSVDEALGPLEPERSVGYLRLLMLLLLPAALFNSFDAELRALLLPEIQSTFHVSVATLGLMNIPIQAGQFASYFVIRFADKVGRRRILLWSIVGYTLFTGATAASFNIYSYASLQFGAQLFIGTEFGAAVLMVVEEFPEEKRGRALARLLLFGPLGGIFAGLLGASGLQHTDLGWRSFYLVGIVPLLVVSVGRHWMRESRVFLASRQKEQASRQDERYSSQQLATSLEKQGAVAPLSEPNMDEPNMDEPSMAILHLSAKSHDPIPEKPHDLPKDQAIPGYSKKSGKQELTSVLSAWSKVMFEAWHGQTKKYIILVGLISFLQTLPATAAIGWWAFYAERERHFPSTEASTFFAIAAAVSMAGYYLCGRSMERFGRKPTAILFVAGSVVSGVAVFQLHGSIFILIALVLAAGFGLGIGPVLSAFATELFPTEVRAQASAWIRNGFANTGSLLGPAIVGVLAQPTGLIGNVGNSVSLLALLAVPAMWIVWRYIPETKGIDLAKE